MKLIIIIIKKIKNSNRDEERNKMSLSEQYEIILSLKIK